LIASCPVENEDQIMLVTDQGQMTRVPVEGKKPIRVISRGSQSVMVFDTADEEKVVSVERISEPEDDEGPEDEVATDLPDAPDGPETSDAPDDPETPDEPTAE
ncbi:MAG TPA: DNA gyrase C-terminal beta-propeller domain-containing protein, partial [Devosia sp.]|nr:DNA gyrase C-terminal beta-propeller domain-containing protein [Devosia sp.]